jgi:hypothetical protein
MSRTATAAAATGRRPSGRRVSTGGRRARLARHPVARDVLAALPAWLVARALVAAGFVLAAVVSHELRPAARPFQLTQGLLAWDGEWYRRIADLGYGAIDPEAVRFFPLFPLAGRALAVVLPGGADVALVVLANLAALAAGALVHRLVLVDTADPGAAARAAWLVALVPPAFVLAFAYAEPLMLALAVGTFLALRRCRWPAAAGLGLLAALARPVGAALAVAAAVEAARGWRRAPAGERAGRVAAVLGPLVGAGLYLAWSALAEDDALAPLRLQEGFRGELVDPVSRLVEAVRDVLGSEALGDGLHLPFALAAVGLLVVVGRRWPASYTAFAAVVLVVALSAENLNSLERYSLNAFPLVLGLASLTAGRRVEGAVLAVCGAGLVALTTLSLVGSYVP